MKRQCEHLLQQSKKQELNTCSSSSSSSRGNRLNQNKVEEEIEKMDM
jgi:hypothetical protein